MGCVSNQKLMSDIWMRGTTSRALEQVIAKCKCSKMKLRVEVEQPLATGPRGVHNSRVVVEQCCCFAAVCYHVVGNA